MAEQTEQQQVFTRLGHLKSERASWFQHWIEVSSYLLPRHGRFFLADRNRGYKRNMSIYDNSATRALGTLSAGLMGGLTSPARPWFRLGVADPDLNDYYPVKEWLAQCTRIMLDIFAKSNTYRTLHSVYRELGAFGTSATILTEDFSKVIHHYPLTTGEYCIAQNWQGRVDTIYREFDKPVGEIVREFGRENCSEHVKSLFDRGNLDQWVTLVHAIEPREVREYGKRDAKNMPWKSIYFERGGDPDKPLRVSGYKKFPGLCPRWDVAGGDIYGNSPGMEALGDIKQLQQEQLRKSQGIDYQTNPPLQVPTALKNRDVDRFPGGITFYDANSPSAGIKTMFEVALNLDHLRLDIEDVRARIRGSFYADLFMMLQQDSADTRKTATEVAELHEEKMLMLGPVLERLHNELLDPLIEVTFDRMLESGIMPPPPPELQGMEINVELVSVLAQAQRAIATNGIDRFVGNLGAIAQFKPDILDKFDADKWADIYSDITGVDPELIVPSDKVAIVRQQRAQQQAQMAKAQMAEQQATAMQKLGSVQTQGGASNAGADVLSNLTGYT